MAIAASLNHLTDLLIMDKSYIDDLSDIL